MISRTSLVAAVLGLVAVQLHAQDAAAAPPTGASDVENKLWKITTLEDAFLKSARRRNLLDRFIGNESAKLKNSTDAGQIAEIRENVATARKQLNTLAVAMDIVFGVGTRREYEYNPITSTVYLKVGTIEDAFFRATRTRDTLATFVLQQKKLEAAETDAEAKAAITAKIEQATRQYQAICAALDAVFGVKSERNYIYNPADSTLYLKISEAELEKIKIELKKIQAQQSTDTGE